MSKKLLVADDSPTIHKVVALAFAGEDFQIEKAVDGQGLVEVIRSTRPDLLLLDASLPGLSGYEVCQCVKSDPDLEPTPVVLLTGATETFDEDEGKRVRCDAHLGKPFDTGELLRTVQGLLGTSAESAVPAKELVSARTRESFLGSGSILDVFGPAVPKPRKPQKHHVTRTEQPATVAIAEPLPPPPPPPPPAEEVSPPASAVRQVIPFPGPKASETQAAPVELPDEILNAIAERAVRQLSPDVIREIAWEVVPELAEIIIRQYLDEHGIAKK